MADGTTLGLEPQLAAGRFDLAVLTFPVPGRDLVSELLFEEDIVLVVPIDDDPLSGAEHIDIADLERFELLLPAPGTPFRGEIDAAVKPAGVRLRPRVELDGVRLLASLTFEGYGPAVLPATAVPPHLRPRFRLVDVDGLPPRRVGIAQRSRGLPSAPARAVLDTLRELMATPDRLPPGVHPCSGRPPHARRRITAGRRACPTAERGVAPTPGCARPVTPALESGCGWTRPPPHQPQRRPAARGADLAGDLEPVVSVEGEVALLGGLQVRGEPLGVDPVEHGPQEGRTHPGALAVGVGAERGQVPVRVLRAVPRRRR